MQVIFIYTLTFRTIDAVVLLITFSWGQKLQETQIFLNCQKSCPFLSLYLLLLLYLSTIVIFGTFVSTQ